MNDPNERAKIEQRRKNRYPAVAQLVEGEDDDLLAWFMSLPKGSRQQALKDMLRRGLDLPPHIPIEIEQGTNVPSATKAQIEWMASEIIRLNDENKNQRDWIERSFINMNNRFEQLVSGGPDIQEEPLESVKGISEDIRDRRIERLKNRKW